MVTFRSMVILMVLVAFLSMGVACSSKEPADQTAGVTEQNQPEAGVTEQNQPEAGVTEQNQPEADVTEQNQPEADVTEQNQPEAGVTEQNQPEADVTEQNQPEAGVTEQNQPEADVTEQNQPEAGVTEQNQPEADVAEQNQPEAEPTEGQPVEAQEDQTGIEPNTVADNTPGAEMPKTLELTGTVKQEGDTIVLTTDIGDYIISGQDLSGLVGKLIIATGTVEDVNGQPAINVKSFSEKQE